MAFRSGIQLSDNYLRAMDFAFHNHSGQFRKGNRAPYISHPISVSSLVLEFCGSEEQAITALLHDLIEDCAITKEEIAKKFSSEIAELVDECSEMYTKKSGKPWRERKEHYLEQISKVSESALLVVACDKLHNLSSFVRDLRQEGEHAWRIFTAEPEDIRWYFGEILEILSKRQKALGSRGDFLLKELNFQYELLICS